MEPRDRERLTLNYDLLIARVNVDHVILYLNRIVFSEIECDRIHSAKTYEDRMKKLLELLQKKGPHAYQHFRHALLDRYSDVVKKLDETSSRILRLNSTPDDAKGANAELLAVRGSLIRNLEINSILEYLVVEDVFSEEDCHRVRAGLRQEDKARLLLDTVAASEDPDAYQKFKMAVMVCQPKLASVFENNLHSEDW
ncbi:uncharacterized protein LOC117118736 [Anneissia japonica]|uniref:uncharacterized protein LOC117118736 n=1 Tax=Anneissia japonica TaxID=1529436 RepID=UPI0014255087|nr:uncharacterized protein LOC117118736 [Anneissia japonica]